MTFPSVRYSTLQQEDNDDDDGAEPTTQMEGSGFVFGTPEGTFDSPFTYANYNDLDRMGYEGPKRQGNQIGNRYSHFTYNNYFDNMEEKETPTMNPIETVIYIFSLIIVLFTLPLSLLFVMKFVSTSERLVVLRLGRAQKTRGPGAAFVLPCIDTTYKINTTITAFNVPPLQIITIDRGLVELGATVYLRIRDPVAAICSIQDSNTSTRTLANTMLYRYISKKRICDITNGQDRRLLAGVLKDELESFTATYGVEITNVEISDVKVLQEGENMGLAALSAVVRSGAGQKLWEVIAPHVEQFAREKRNQQENNAPADPTTTSTPNCPATEQLIDIEQKEPRSIDEDQLITAINMAIDEPLTKAIGRVFQIRCPDISIVIDLKHQPGSCTKGTALNPDVVFEMNDNIFKKIITEQLSPVSAYMQGDLLISGSIQDAMSLKYLAERVKQLL